MKHTSQRPARASASPSTAGTERATTARAERPRFTTQTFRDSSYDGESRNARVYRTNLPGFEAVRLIKVGKGLHYIDEERQITEKATGEKHPEASWLVDIERA